MPSSSSLIDFHECDTTSSPTIANVGKVHLEKFETNNDEYAVALASPQRRPNFTAFSYEDLEESIADSWTVPHPHMCTSELGSHIPPPIPVIVTPKRSETADTLETDKFKEKEKEKEGRPGVAEQVTGEGVITR